MFDEFAPWRKARTIATRHSMHAHKYRSIRVVEMSTSAFDPKRSFGLGTYDTRRLLPEKLACVDTLSRIRDGVPAQCVRIGFERLTVDFVLFEKGAVMEPAKRTASVLDGMNVHVKLKLAALWTSLVLCFLYGDYFGLYKPGKLDGMLDGRMGPLGQITQHVLLGTAVLMAIPSVMVYLSVALKPGVNRWVNIVLGAVFAAIMLVTMQGAWNFYIFLGVIEVVLCLLIIWHAWTWPRRETA